MNLFSLRFILQVVLITKVEENSLLNTEHAGKATYEHRDCQMGLKSKKS